MKTVAEFSIQYLRMLDENGTLNAQFEPPITKNEIIDLYKIMQIIRIFDNAAIHLQRTGQMGTYAPIAGQEAIGTAIGFTMGVDDVFIPYYRDYAAQFQRGTKLSEILTYWGGNEKGNCFVNNHDFPMCVPIASQCLHAAGVAFSMQYKKNNNIAVVTLGDGATSEGDFYEAINIAGVWNLPIVFVINNNKWAISVPTSKQTAAETLAQKAIAAGMYGIQVDGNDLFALIASLRSAISRARQNEGPTLIEAITYRMSDHTTADDAKRYRPEQEFINAQKLDPIKRIKNYLEKYHSWNNDLDNQLLLNAGEIVELAQKEYLKDNYTDPNDSFKFHFAEFPDYLYEQKAEFMEDMQNG